MKTFLETYGESILIVVAIIALIVLIVAVIQNTATQDAFIQLVTDFMDRANDASGLHTSP